MCFIFMSSLYSVMKQTYVSSDNIDFLMTVQIMNDKIYMAFINCQVLRITIKVIEAHPNIRTSMRAGSLLSAWHTRGEVLIVKPTRCTSFANSFLE